MKKSMKILIGIGIFAAVNIFTVGGFYIDALRKECKYLQNEVIKSGVCRNAFFLYDDKDDGKRIVRRGNMENLIEGNNFFMTPEAIQYLSAWKSPFNGERFLEEDLSEYMKNPKQDSFGARRRHENGTIYKHQGIDLFAPMGTALYPIGNYGKVTAVHKDPHETFWVKTEGDSILVEYGKTVEITHPIGIVSRYAHLEEIVVEEGELVYWNSLIGTVGRTGNAANSNKKPHLHLETILDGEAVDPLRIINSLNNNLAISLREYFEKPKVKETN